MGPKDKRYLVHPQEVGMLFKGKIKETPIPGVSSNKFFVVANVLAPFLRGCLCMDDAICLVISRRICIW